VIDPARFIREHTELLAVPFVPEIRIRTATELLPLWHVTDAWLTDKGIGLPYWCVPWAGGKALARFLLDQPSHVRGLRVLDFGTGSGLVAIAAKLAGAAEVVAIDRDPLAIAACSLNAEANSVSFIAQDSAMVGRDVDADVIVAGDIWYEAEPAAHFARWLRAQAQRGVRVLTGDPGRAYVPSDAIRLATFDVPTSLDLESASSRQAHVLELPVTDGTAAGSGLKSRRRRLD
jgi:predicted nicotinamide N-methyase